MLALTATTATSTVGWSGSGCFGSGTCVVVLDHARAVVADFTPITRTLTVTKTGPNSSMGTVTSNPTGISCGSTCSAGYDHGAVVVLTATTAMGTFVWSGGGCSGSGTCTVTMDSAQSVTATFNP